MIIPALVAIDAAERTAPQDPLASKEGELTLEEMLAKRVDPERGLFFCTPVFINALREPQSNPLGAVVATRNLFRDLAAHERVRRWYVAHGRLETYPVDRDPQLLLADHVVPAPIFNPVSYSEATVLFEHAFIHAIVSPGPLWQGLLLRGALGSVVPHVALLHTVPEPTISWLPNVGPPTYPHDLILSPSQCGKRAVEAHFERLQDATGKRPFAGEIRVIPYGVDNDMARPERADARKRLGWAEDDAVFVVVARIDRDFKFDPSPLLIAFHHLYKKHPHARLVIAGAAQESDLQLIDAEVKALGLDARVELRRNFPESQKAYLLAGADVFVAFSDNVQETHGVGVVEAMAAGLPVVASEWDGYRESVVDGVTGILIPTHMRPADPDLRAVASVEVNAAAPQFQYQQTVIDLGATLAAFERLLADPALRRRMGDAGRTRAREHFDGKKRAAEVIAVIEERIARSKNVKPILTGDVGADWTKVYGHYPTTLIGDGAKITRGPFTLADLTTPTRMGLEIDRRPMIVALLEDAAASLASPSTLGALAQQLKPRHPLLNTKAIERWLVRGAKYGLFKIG